jgi:hypothetical protein
VASLLIKNTRHENECLGQHLITMPALWHMLSFTLQEAASSILNQAKRRSGESGRALFESFARLSDQLIRTCMWQPPSDRRVSKCSAFKEFKHLVNMLPVDVQVPVQVTAPAHFTHVVVSH